MAQVYNMNITIKMVVTNGFTAAVCGGVKQDLVRQLVEKTNGAIQPRIPAWPHLLEDFPDNGWISFDYIIKCPIRVDVASVIAQKAGIFNFLAKRLMGASDVARILGSEIKKSIESSLGEKDWFGISGKVEFVNVDIM